jgi:ankyrin repeat protein
MPLFSAADEFQHKCAKLLLEYCADVNQKNDKNNTIFQHSMGGEFRLFFEACVHRLNEIVPQLVLGRRESLERVIEEHLSGLNPLCTLRSRFINGSTLLHTCVYFGHADLVVRLLNAIDGGGMNGNETLDPNIRDYKGATCLHRCRSTQMAKILIDFGANVNVKDLDGNTPLHVKAYGEKNLPSELDVIELLLQHQADPTMPNKKKLIPIHFAAIQGRSDVIELLMKNDKENKQLNYLISKNSSTSLTYLSVQNDYLVCARWLLNRGFQFKSGEPDALLFKILIEEITIKNIEETIVFLYENGCNLNARYTSGNT